MPSHKNKVIIACAGSGKTTRLVTEALAAPDRRVAVVTYTNANVAEIAHRFSGLNCGVPENVQIASWYSFLIRECARPYQTAKYSGVPIETISFSQTASTRGVPEAKTKTYYFATDGVIHQDKLGKFILECERLSGGAVTRRLSQIYTDIFVDEVQDLAGYDWDLIKMLFRSQVRVVLVGDPRQSTYSTNASAKNKAFRKSGMLELIEKWPDDGLCEIENSDTSHRCNQEICDFANALWPGMSRMTSQNMVRTGHDGLFVVPPEHAANYLRQFGPQVLRYSKTGDSFGVGNALNFGGAKGLQFDRVLISPTGPIRSYLKTGDVSKIDASKDKFHVAVTRAKFSVGFVTAEASPLIPTWRPS